MNNQIISAMQWRYAAKSFDPKRRVSEEDINTIIESMRLSPSAFGLEPWKFIIVGSEEVKQQLADGAPHNRGKIETASHVLILARNNQLPQSYLNEHMEFTSETRGQALEDIQPFHEKVSGKIKAMSDEEVNSWTARQLYIPLGSALMASALLRVDSCALEGIDTAAFDRILGLEGTDYTTTVSLVLGYRSENDPFANLAKVRYPDEQIVQRL